MATLVDVERPLNATAATLTSSPRYLSHHSPNLADEKYRPEA